MTILVYSFGALLCLALVIVIVHYFSPKRKDKVEQPKYNILDNGDKNDDKKA